MEFLSNKKKFLELKLKVLSNLKKKLEFETEVLLQSSVVWTRGGYCLGWV